MVRAIWQSVNPGLISGRRPPSSAAQSRCAADKTSLTRNSLAFARIRFAMFQRTAESEIMPSRARPSPR